MSETVSRDKYESLKEKTTQWMEKALEYQSRYETILQENEKLVSENDELQERLLMESEYDKTREIELEQENEILAAKLEKCEAKYKEARKKLKEIESERNEERLLEKLTQRLNKRTNN